MHGQLREGPPSPLLSAAPHLAIKNVFCALFVPQRAEMPRSSPLSLRTDSPFLDSQIFFFFFYSAKSIRTHHTCVRLKVSAELIDLIMSGRF